MTATKRARIDPATKAQAALDVGVRKLAALDANISKAKYELDKLQAQRPTLATEVDYLANNPAITPPGRPADAP